MRYALTVLPPAEAAEALRRDPRGRPPADAPGLAALVARINDGGWIFNGATIRFGRGGAILDGRLRLAAAVAAGRPMPALVVSDLAPPVLLPPRRSGPAAAPDGPNGRAPSLAELLGEAGLAAARAAEPLARLLLAQQGGRPVRRCPEVPWWRVQLLLDAQPALLEAAAAPLPTDFAALPEEAARMLLFLGGFDPPALARLRPGLAVPSAAAPGDPGRRLAEAARAARGAPAASAPLRLLAAIIEALNAARAGAAPTAAPWVPGRALPRLLAMPDLAGAAPPGMVEIHPDPAAGMGGVVLRRGLVTAAEAAGLLRGGADPAGISRALVRDLAGRMAAGRWLLDIDPVCVAPSGRVLKGRHRLLAMVEAGVDLPLPVLHGVPETATATYGRPPQAWNAAAAIRPGFGDVALVSAMANLLWRREIAPPGARRRKATAAEVEAILAAHPRLFELRSLARRSEEFARASVAGYAAYVAEREDPGRARAFLAVLDPGQAAEGRAAALRRRLLRLRRTGASAEEQLDAILEGWQAMRAAALESAR